MSERRCVKLSEFYDTLTAHDARLPLLVTADLTYRCNFRCAHCFCRLPENAPQAQRELTFDEWDRILGECVDEGTLYLALTGGEPLLHPDFRRIWLMAKRRGLLLTLLSNASLITSQWVDFFADWPPQKVSVTLYAATEETHRRVTGVPDKYARVRQALDLMVERGLRVEVKAVFTRRNVHEFEAIRRIILEYGSVFRWDAELLGAYSQGGGDPLQERLGAETIVALEQADPARVEAWRRQLEHWQPSPPLRESPFRCAIGQAAPHLDPYGGMRPCQVLESLTYDVRSGSVCEGWREALPRLVSTFPLVAGPCVTCPAAELCRYCPAHALLAGTSVGGPSRFHCELARNRAQIYGLPVQEAALAAT